MPSKNCRLTEDIVGICNISLNDATAQNTKLWIGIQRWHCDRTQSPRVEHIARALSLIEDCNLFGEWVEKMIVLRWKTNTRRRRSKWGRDPILSVSRVRAFAAIRCVRNTQLFWRTALDWDFWTENKRNHSIVRCEEARTGARTSTNTGIRYGNALTELIERGNVLIDK